MKHPLITMGLLGLLGATPTICWTMPVKASNSNVESTVKSFGDLSIFDQAMANTGVANELNDNEHYTIFAPTNEAFAQIQRQTYPCFYDAQCRPQMATLLRGHIISGRHDLKELASYGSGIQTAGNHKLQISEAYVGDYTADGHKVLSKTDVGGNIIYRVDGVMASPQELAQFQTVSMMPASTTDTVTTQRTTQTIYQTQAPIAMPSQAYSDGRPPAYSDGSETTTIIRSSTTQQQ